MSGVFTRARQFHDAQMAFARNPGVAKSSAAARDLAAAKRILAKPQGVSPKALAFAKKALSLDASADLRLKAKSLGLTLPPAPDEPARVFARTRAGVAPKLRPNPGQLITVDPKLNDIVTALMEAVAPKLAAAMERHLVALAFRAAESWPVESGLSRALLYLDFRVNGPYLIGSLISGAPYTRFIKGQPFRTLVDRPGRAVAEQIARECLDELATVEA